jgi:putative alpha-1,2-mannosidase
LTQKWVREVIDTAKSDITPHGGYGGDEDQGMMGSLNALMSIGLFSLTGMCEENPSYELTTPLFDKVTVNQPDGTTFTIESSHSSKDDLYIQSASLNGKPLEGFRVPQDAVFKGGVLKLELGSEPNETWGT